jgi:hypothetical protein
MFRSFKRHYHVTKRAYADAAEIGELNFTISQSQGGPVTYSEKAPERDKMARLSALIYKFLDEKNELYYRKILDLIKTEFPNAVSAEDIQAIEDGVAKIERGGFPITINDKEYTAKQIFNKIAEAGYHEQKEEAQKFIEDIAKMPLVYNIFWNQFKSYTINAFRIISVLFDLIQEIENHEEYKDRFKPKESHIKKCIYCLSEKGDFNTEEHIFPESLAGDAIYLPRRFVCDTCNNEISSQLDNELINSPPIAYLRVIFTPYTKAGKFPKANFSNMAMEKTDPNQIKIVLKDKSGGIKDVKNLKNGQVSFNMTWKSKKLDWKLYARAIYKIALGFVAYDLGHEAALDAKYQPARDFILKGISLDNNMMVSTKTKPHPELRTSYHPDLEGTQFLIDIFGMIFKINLEEKPLVYRHPALDAVLKYIAEDYTFEFFSLK